MGHVISNLVNVEMVGIAPIFCDFGDGLWHVMALAFPQSPISRSCQEKGYGPSLGDELRVRGELGGRL